MVSICARTGLAGNTFRRPTHYECVTVRRSILFRISRVFRRRDRALSWLDHERGFHPFRAMAIGGRGVSVGLVVDALAAP